VSYVFDSSGVPVLHSARLSTAKGCEVKLGCALRGVCCSTMLWTCLMDSFF